MTCFMNISDFAVHCKVSVSILESSFFRRINNVSLLPLLHAWSVCVCCVYVCVFYLCTSFGIKSLVETVVSLVVENLC